MDYDVIIIGAGVVGLACAAKCSTNGMKTLAVERHSSFGYETSSRNSEVIHAGIYYPSGTLKAGLCVQGNKSIYEWCGKYNVPVKKTGKFIIAITDEEKNDLKNLYMQAKANGVVNITDNALSKLNSEEPNVKAVDALWSPDTGIINSHLLMESLYFVAKDAGSDFAWKHTVSGIEKIAGGYLLNITAPDGEIFTITTTKLVNSAGLDSDTVAAMAGIDVDKEGYRLHYSRGHYFRIKPVKSNLVNHLIYPIPLKSIIGLGIHVTIELDGQLKLGPDSIYLKERKQDYEVPESLKEKFYKAASSYLIGLELDDILPDQSGIRPKLQPEGGEFRDFIISEESKKGLPGLVNLVGIESPGLTCCLEIANLTFGMLA